MIALIALLASQALADDIVLTSRVESVTVFQGQARVTRVATVKVPAGRSDLVFEGMPIHAQENSMTAAGEGHATLLGVDVRAVHGTEDRDERVRTLREQRQDLADQVAAHQDTVARVGADIAFLKSIQPKATPQLQADLFLAKDASAQLSTLSSGLQVQLRALLAEQRTAERAVRDLNAQIAATDRQIAQIGSETRDAKRAAVGINASVPGTVTVHLSYLVPGATWTPRYDARYDLSTNRVRLDLSGVIQQTTGEDWLGADLVVSTGAATRGTEPPKLEPFVLGQSNRSRQPLTTTASLVSEFPAARPVDVPSDGSSRQVRLTSVDLKAQTVHRVVARRTPVAYLTARVTNEADFGFMPGPVNSYLGSAFVGRGNLPATGQGGQVDLSFGVDDRVAVERVRMEDVTLSQKALSNRERQAWGFETRVTNRTGAPIHLIVQDQIPGTREEQYTVEATTQPEVSLPKDGVFEWEADLANGAKQVFVLEYEVSWPEGQRPMVLD